MNNNKDKWSWKEISNKKFDEMNKISNYYRIYHIENGVEVNDYKFWRKNENLALIVLNEFKADHKDTKKKYFYASSGYCWYGKNKRYDTMKEMHNAFNDSKYDKTDREYDISKINKFLKSYEEEKVNDVLLNYRLKVRQMKDSVDSFIEERAELVRKINDTDLNTANEDTMHKLTMAINRIDNKYYDIRDAEYLNRTKHNISESWDLYHHILYDIKYNVKKLLESEHSFPTIYEGLAAKQLKHASDKKIRELAYQMWNTELHNLIDYINNYLYYESYGIVDEKDEDLVETAKRLKNTIPYKEGTNKELNYSKLHELTQNEWNKIWVWMKKYGQSLWD